MVDNLVLAGGATRRRAWHRVRGFVVIAAALAVTAAMSVSFGPPAAAQPVASTSAQPSANAHPQLTKNKKAACNTKPKKGHARCLAVVRTPADGEITPLASGPPASALGPADIQDAYNLPADHGGGQTVAIVDAFGYSTAEEDLAAFRDHYGLPPCTTDNGCFTKVDQRGGTDFPPDNVGWALETALDLDAVSSACPKCHILLVEGDSNAVASLAAAVDTAVQLGAKYVSNSYGAGDIWFPDTYDKEYDHPGVAVVASSGDNANVVNWPSSIPTVTSVGGTRLSRDTSTPRGWDEAVCDWNLYPGCEPSPTGRRSGGGSGCSSVESKPDFQSANGLDTHCDNRATADIAADADPASGLAVYDTLGRSGWLQVGGTSLSSPLVAGMYALAGTPDPGTYPVAYPYDPAAHAHLFDVTEGVNGGCGNLLCQAGPGWDGPTGWGTPNGVQALTTGPHGTIAGQVTDAGSGDSLGGATVSTPQGYTATTDKDGHYALNGVLAGPYDVTAAAYGYADKTQAGVQVTDGGTATVDFVLSSTPAGTLSGVVTDGSGHGWPLHAKITIDGYPKGAVYTDPYTGHYSVDLPQRHTYTLHVTALDLGYQAEDVAVPVVAADAHQDIALTIDSAACTAPGYARATSERFSGWSGTTPQDGWTVVDNAGTGATWTFSNPGSLTPPYDGDFASVDGRLHPVGERQDTSMVSPVMDLSHANSPKVQFDTSALGWRNRTNMTTHVDLSVDSGKSWKTLWGPTAGPITGRVTIPIPRAAGLALAHVQVRFHYSAGGASALGNYNWWAVDNVSLGDCLAVPGGLVAGVVTDANTGDLVDNVTVASDATSDESATTATTSDPSIPGGFYTLFSSHTGATSFTASRTAYQSASSSATVETDAVVHKDWVLDAGHLTISRGNLATTETLGQSASKKLTLTNNGTAPLHVTLGAQTGKYTPQGQPTAQMAGAPVRRVRIEGDTDLGPAVPRTATGDHNQATPATTKPGSAWQPLASYPISLKYGNTAATDPQTGKVYSIGGMTSGKYTAKGYTYDRAANRWLPITDTPKALYMASAAFVDGTLYLIGGWSRPSSTTYRIESRVYAYKPGADHWTAVASLPAGRARSTVAVLDGKLYVVGGCSSDNSCGGASDTVYRYDPQANKWAQLASYPVPIVGLACAGIVGELVCAGGEGGGTLASTHIYNPANDTWRGGADIPVGGIANMAYAGANGKLQIVGGMMADGIAGSPVYLTNEAHQYDPVTNTWSTLPNASYYAMAFPGACGFYRITNNPEVLPGYDSCNGAGGTPWLSQHPSGLDLAPGGSASVTVKLDSAEVDQPGVYEATLWARANDPYPVQTVSVTMTANAPTDWHKVSGTVTDADGQPIASATIAATTLTGSHGGQGVHGRRVFAARTDPHGYYQWWLSDKYRTVQVSAAKDWYQPQARRVVLESGGPSAVDFILQADTATSVYKSSDRGPAHGGPSTKRTRSAPRLDAAAVPPTAKRSCAQPTKAGRAACLSLVRTDVKPRKRLLSSDATPYGYGPADLQSAYGLPSATAGDGQTVAIVDAFDDPTAEADLQTYRQEYGLPPCTSANGCFTKVNQRGEEGNYPPANASWAVEEALDIDMVSAACPNCNILLVEADDNTVANLNAAEDEAVALGAKFVSNSWGSTEWSAESGSDSHFEHPGVAITAATGDSGYGVNYPAASAHVTAVGGTTLRQSGGSRGWSETVWTGTGSGCSAYEAKPVWQQDTGCEHHTTADISAVADPDTGVAVYQSGGGGWLVVGGTSAASPIVAATYALAGAPTAGTYPSSYPYLNATGLNDVTSGSNGVCDPAYLCTAGPGFDGPTGLGTPRGVDAFTPVASGTLTGTVTDADTGKPVSGAEVHAAGLTATTDHDGRYTLAVATGDYRVAATNWGYAAKAVEGVQVAAGKATEEDFALTRVDNMTVTGTVTDGSGHGWPVHTQITVDGVGNAPTEPVYADPFTGRYTLTLPGRNTYNLHVAPLYPGYDGKDVSLTVGTSNMSQDIAISASKLSCTSAPGYAYGPGYEQFTDWPVGSDPLDGWTNVDNTGAGSGWYFGDARTFGFVDNPTGGTGEFAVTGGPDNTLISPVVDLTHVASPKIRLKWAQTLPSSAGSNDMSIDLSIDGGQTWQSAWHETIESIGWQTDQYLDISIPQAADKSRVQVRFRFVNTRGTGLWVIDDVLVGSLTCAPVSGGLIAGVVTDANTGQPVNAAAVASDANPQESSISAASDDPAMPGGFYSLFSSHTGDTEFGVTDGRYVPARGSVTVAADKVTRKDWVLEAGHLSVSETGLSTAETLGQSNQVKLTITNDGTAPLQFTTGRQAGEFTPTGQHGGSRSGTIADGNGSSIAGAPEALQRTPSAGSAWTGISPYPTVIDANAVARDPLTGRVYSVGGDDDPFAAGVALKKPAQSSSKGFVYDPSDQEWHAIADAPRELADAAAAFLNGTLYVIGGWTTREEATAGRYQSDAVYAYTPGADSWSQVASLPLAVAGAAAAVLDGKLYVVGGCAAWYCYGSISRTVYRYDPAFDTWTRLADYPNEPGISFEACAGIDAEVVCAGGLSGAVPDAGTYIYNPRADMWSTGAAMPYKSAYMAYSGANGKLQVVGGYAARAISRASEYDPATNMWTALPGLDEPWYGGGSSCGIYLIGGANGVGAPPQSSARVLPGYDQCDGAGDTSWLTANPSGSDLAPGQSVTVTVTLDSAKVSQPGSYAASLWAATDTPYPVTVVPVTMEVKPPATWGLVAGRVLDRHGKDPIRGATVQLCSNYNTHRGTCGPATYTLKTDAGGEFQWWLDTRYNSLQAIAAKDGYIQQVRAIRVRPSRTTTQRFRLAKFEPGPHSLRGHRSADDAHPDGSVAMPRQRPGVWPG